MRLSSCSKVDSVDIQPKANSLKTFNDPIYGFISIQDSLIFKLIEHPYFQRLRRISQLGLTNLVYGGANHSRFQHALGAMNLMRSAINVLRAKGIEITPEEEQASKAAILLHDIGHGPFSHALENTIVRGIDHERIGLTIMKELNDEFNGELNLAISIFSGQHPKKFLHQLVSSQLDTDRLDYLKRDSFFTGVSEGVIGSERIIKMLAVHDGELAVEAKGLYSLEKFLIARRLMYWQVYLHKTVVSAEFLLMQILIRAKEQFRDGVDLWASGSLRYFLEGKNLEASDTSWLSHFLKLDDYDIFSSIKQWIKSDDKVLGELCERLINRKLLKVKLLEHPLDQAVIDELREEVAKELNWSKEEASYLLFQNSLSNTAYNPESERITVLYKDGSVQDISNAASIFRFSSLEAQETKNYLYYPTFLNV
ncbi:MAG: HD domain-containing protein [Flavobacteriales bacterium]|nr:HD domain-containing protein [Flavobacteriales bacterium]NCG29767.1 HD domain-containing protein [Bacteroidota bacterium]MBT3963480.1 HD domain-containing protein [Flavobacteriales bacterium]MBT4704755.1 HD domain-containing protein [Flavobacteriales bacterium]MBT4931662.1 HD domain-containing protein [Flavobacteriales bacterium]